MNQQFGKQAFDQAEKFFKDARVPENMQAMAQQGVAATQVTCPISSGHA